MKSHKLKSISVMIDEAAPSPGFEFSESQLEALRTVGQVALGIVVLGGVIAISAMAPNLFVALNKIFGKKQYGSRNSTLEKRKEQLKKSFYYMREQGYINIEKRGEFLFVSTTKKGRSRFAKIVFDNLTVNRPKRWEKTWWFVLADIPSRQFRHRAYYFQKKLKAMGFYPLQRTVWVYPFDPRQEIEAVAGHYKLNPFVTAIEVKRLDSSDEEVLLKFFKKRAIV